MKKERAEAKREKKVAKKIADQEKQEQKVAKKAAKDEAKKAKEAAKQQAKATKANKGSKAAKAPKESPTSKGKSSAEKTKARKTKKKGVKVQKTELVGGVSHQAEDTPAIESDERPEPSAPEDVQVALPDCGFQETVPEVPVQSRKMKRLRHLSAAWKSTDVVSDADAPIESPESPASSPPKMAKMMNGKCPKGNETEGDEDASRKEAIENHDLELKESKEQGGNQTKEGKAKKEKKKNVKNAQSRSKDSSKERKLKGGEVEMESKGSKQPKKKAAAKASAGKTRKPKVEVPVDEPAKAVLLETLKECDSSNCTHPSFVHPQPTNGISFSTYWTRNTVGLKVASRFLNNRKAKGNGWSQIAYFGNKSPCAYASLVAAGIYVSRYFFVRDWWVSHSLMPPLY